MTEPKKTIDIVADANLFRLSFRGPVVLLWHALLLPALCFFFFAPAALALGQPAYVEHAAGKGSFAIADHGMLATICVDADDFPGVIRAARDLRDDIQRVTGHAPPVSVGSTCAASHAIIIGTLEKSVLLSALARAK